MSYRKSRAASQFGNIQVRLFNHNHQLLVDSGLPDGSNEFLWFMLPIRATDIPPGVHLEDWIIGMPLLRQTILEQERLPIFEQLPPNTPMTIVRRVEEPWGYRLSFETTTLHRLLPLDERRTVIGDTDRSQQVITVPIGERRNPIGYVELSNGLNFEAEALTTTQRALLIAGSATVLLAVILGLVMGKRLSTPITKLTQTTRIMSSGDLSVRASLVSKDEIGELATQFNQMAEQLHISFDQLATERDTLRRFIADADHELRTPITALKNFNDLLQGSAADDEQARVEFLDESQVQLNRLSWITKNLLDLSRLDAGLANLDFALHEVNSLIESAEAPYRTISDEKAITVTINNPPSSLKVHCDRAWVETAISNLLDNALKFTSSGGHIHIGADQMGNDVRIWVHDSGPGIPKNDLPYIFDRFYRAQNSREKGSGLGLAIVQSVMQAHDGKVSVKSHVGEGTTFTIELPIA